MLTIAAVKAASASSRAVKLFDGGGLFLYVTAAGTKSWRMKYRRAGREKLLVLGRFPEMSLAAARAAREEAKACLRDGRDPASRPENLDTFEQLARAWYRHGLADWSAAHAADVLASLERDVFPAIGARPVAAIDPPELLAAMRAVEARGCIETARRVRQRLSAVFGFGIAQGLRADDPAARIGRAMGRARVARPMPALTDIDDCRALLAATDRLAVGNPMVVLAHRLLALTAVRLEAVRGMRWDELEDIGGPEPVWRVPAARMKLSRAKKGDARFDHVVPLAPPAIAVLNAARCSMPAGSNLVFPGRGKNSPIGENALRDLIGRTPLAGRHVPHGWRSSFSTILNEDLGPQWRSDIDRALAHSPKDKVEAAYNRAAQLDRRRAVYDRWGELLMAGGASPIF